jgi:hypothetical protein
VLLCIRSDNKTRCFAGILEPSDGLEPSTPSLPWKFRSVTRVHARSFATQFFLQIRLSQAVARRGETTRVSFLMCPFCVRRLVSIQTTRWRRLGSAPGRSANVMCQPPLVFSAFHWTPCARPTGSLHRVAVQHPRPVAAQRARGRERQQGRDPLPQPVWHPPTIVLDHETHRLPPSSDDEQGFAVSARVPSIGIGPK